MTATPHTRSLRTALLAAAGAALLLTLAACGGGEAQSREFDLSVAHGNLIGENTFVVKQGDSVTLNLTTDSEGVFHVHGYDLRQRVVAGDQGVIAFEADSTGRFEIALHPAHDTHDTSGDGDIVIATLEVQPR